MSRVQIPSPAPKISNSYLSFLMLVFSCPWILFGFRQKQHFDSELPEVSFSLSKRRNLPNSQVFNLFRKKKFARFMTNNTHDLPIFRLPEECPRRGDSVSASFKRRQN